MWVWKGKAHGEGRGLSVLSLEHTLEGGRIICKVDCVVGSEAELCDGVLPPCLQVAQSFLRDRVRYPLSNPRLSFRWSLLSDSTSGLGRPGLLAP